VLGEADKPTAVVVDDHPVVLHGLRDLLSFTCRVVAACGDGPAAVEAVRAHVPDVVVLDIAMPGMDGIQVLRLLREAGHAGPVVFLAATVTDDEVAAAVALKATGILLKESVTADLARLVAAAARGETCFPAWTEDAVRRAAVRRGEAERLLQQLTPREREILSLLTPELSNKLLARRLALSEGTIKLHMHNIYDKLGIATRPALVELAARLREYV
jgi:two-component system, NarL family, nitrate/nitrite response regulator NarL